MVLATDVVGDGATTALTAHDVRTGTDAVLIPRPTETGEEYGLGPIQWVGGLSWWTPGHVVLRHAEGACGRRHELVRSSNNPRPVEDRSSLAGAARAPQEPDRGSV